MLAAVFFIFRNVQPNAEPVLSAAPIEVDYPAPDLTLIDIHGVERSLADFQGQVVLINLWATWCEPCKDEMPALQAFHDEYSDEGLTVIAINDGDPPADVLQFVKDFDLTFPVWFDPTYTATEEAFKTMGLPSSFVIDRSGVVRLYWIGAIDATNLERGVIPIIREEQ
jgi:cytochrome c biogenesis protein CcmG/thiol:disulfide interchange protein DsbE